MVTSPEQEAFVRLLHQRIISISRGDYLISNRGDGSDGDLDLTIPDNWHRITRDMNHRNGIIYSQQQLHTYAHGFIVRFSGNLTILGDSRTRCIGSFVPRGNIARTQCNHLMGCGRNGCLFDPWADMDLDPYDDHPEEEALCEGWHNPNTDELGFPTPARTSCTQQSGCGLSGCPSLPGTWDEITRDVPRALAGNPVPESALIGQLGEHPNQNMRLLHRNLVATEPAPEEQLTPEKCSHNKLANNSYVPHFIGILWDSGKPTMVCNRCKRLWVCTPADDIFAHKESLAVITDAFLEGRVEDAIGILFEFSAFLTSQLKKNDTPDEVLSDENDEITK